MWIRISDRDGDPMWGISSFKFYFETEDLCNQAKSLVEEKDRALSMANVSGTIKEWPAKSPQGVAERDDNGARMKVDIPVPFLKLGDIFTHITYVQENYENSGLGANEIPQIKIRIDSTETRKYNA